MPRLLPPSAWRGQPILAQWWGGSPTTALQPSFGQRPASCSGLLPSLGEAGSAWGRVESRAALLWLPPSPVQKRKGDPMLGGTHVPSAPMWGGSSPHTHAAPRWMWSQAAAPGACVRHGPRAAARCISPGCLAGLGIGPWMCPMCCRPSFRHQNTGGTRTGQENESHAGFYCLSSLYLCSPSRQQCPPEHPDEPLPLAHLGHCPTADPCAGEAEEALIP